VAKYAQLATSSVNMRIILVGYVS